MHSGTGHPPSAAVTQSTVRRETTMARHGTLPEFMYQRQCEVAEKPISIAFSTAEAVTENETVEEAEDDFDESSDEEFDDDPNVSTLVQGEI